MRYTRTALGLLNATSICSDGMSVRHVDRARRQPNRLAMRRQRAARRIDAERADMMLGAGGAVARRAAARRDVQITPRDMRPGILHAGRQRDAFACSQGQCVHVDFVAREHRADIGVQRHFAGLGLRPRRLRHRGSGCDQ